MDFSKLLNAIDGVQSKKTTYKKTNDGEKELLWQGTVDEKGEFAAVIRFLPPKAEDGDLFVRRYQYYFFNNVNGKKRYFAENSPTSIGLEDPIYTMNGDLYNSGNETLKKQATKQRRNEYFYANILVVKDPAKPENNGKVKVFRFGKSIMDLIVKAAKPQQPAMLDMDDDDVEIPEPLNPFDLINGANFTYVCKQVNNLNNYDDSKFGKIKPCPGDHDEIMAQCYDLQEFIKPEKFLTPEELMNKYNWVMNIDQKNSGQQSEKSGDNQDNNLDDDDGFTDIPDSVTMPQKTAEKKSVAADKTAPWSDDDDDGFFDIKETTKQISENVAVKETKSSKATKKPVADQTPAIDDEDDFFKNLVD